MLNVIRNAKKKGLIIAGVAGTLVLASAGMVYYDHGKIGEAEKAISGINNKIAAADARIAKIPSHEDRVLRERIVLGEYVKILPDSEEIHSFVDRITEFATVTGVEIESLSDRKRTGRTKGGASAFLNINYNLELKGTLNEVMDFIHRFETYDRFVSVKQLSISAGSEGGKDGGEEGPPRHEVALELETYVYNPGIKGSKPVEIVNAEERMFEIAETADLGQKLVLDSYPFRSKPDRRDPFVDPRWEDTPLSPEASRDAEAQVAMLSKLEAEFSEIRAGIEEEAKAQDIIVRIELGQRLNTRMATFKRDVDDLENADFFTKRDLRERFQTEIVEPFRKEYEGREALDPGALQLQQLEAEYQRMTIAFDQGRFQDVTQAWETIRTSMTAAVVDSEVKGVVSKMELVASRSATRIEFGQKQIAISGFVFKPTEPERAIVIINDRAYSPGDVLDDGITVGRIDQTRVVFFYKREQFETPLE